MEKDELVSNMNPRKKLYTLLAAISVALSTGMAATASTPPDDPLALQVALARQHFSPGVIDGKWGDNTRAALEAFQSANDLESTGALDDETRQALQLDGLEKTHQVELSSEQVSGPFTEEIPGDLVEQSKLDRLGYTSVEEKLAEEFHVTPELLAELNPDVELTAGATLTVPNLGDQPSEITPQGELTVRVSKSAQNLRVEDDNGVIFFAPVTAGSTASPLPLGEWKVLGISTMPKFYYDPSLFSDAPSDHEKAELPPGPNNPVGVVWIDLDKEHYGIHGTPEPSKIGYTESHGCVRLSNWDARLVAELVEAGTKVVFEK